MAAEGAGSVPIDLSPERGLLFRITHVANLPWLLANGLPCANGGMADPNFVAIGNGELIAKRMEWPVPLPPGGTLANYVPFYFTPKSPMLLNIKTGYSGVTRRSNEDIAILVTSCAALQQQGVTALFTDRHAYTRAAAWTSNPAELAGLLDWDILRRHDFARTDAYPDKMERYQAEALAHQHVPTAALLGIASVSETAKTAIELEVNRAGLDLRVVVRPGWYF